VGLRARLEARQASEGDSLDVQRRQIECYAHMDGLTLDEIMVEEGVSGSVPVENRPVGARLGSTVCFARPATSSTLSRALGYEASSSICSISAATSPAVSCPSYS
jgi:hypothetical protein